MLGASGAPAPDDLRPQLAGREQLTRFVEHHARDGGGTLFLVRLHRYSEMAIGLSADDLARLTEDLWQALERFVGERGRIFRVDTHNFGFLWYDELNHSQCILASTRLLEQLRQLPFCRHADLQISLQMGVARGRIDEGGSDRWIHQTYLALTQSHPLYPAFVVFDPEMEHHLGRRWRLRQGLAQALERQEFELAYQPRVELAGGHCVGVEALLRWLHPEHGVMTPDEFLPLLEDSGVLIELTQWVLHRASRELTEWLKADAERSFAFNVSTKVLIDPEFGEALKHSIGLWGLNPRQVVIEVTETAAWQERESSILVLNELRELGLRVAIDDFGTGYSTLDYLRQLPVDQIKIDRSFVANMLTSRLDVFLVSVVVEIGRELGLTVVAEGVERPEQLERLRQMGCHSAQGYAVAQPMPIAQLLEWVSERSAAQ